MKANNMTPKHEIINRIIAETGAENYVEIGFGTGYNLDKINCHYKIGVDPNYNGNRQDVYKGNSDDFFAENNTDIDVIFIDGDHTKEQARKDIINSLKCNPKVIILHDVLPKNKAMQEVPRSQKEWCGDVYKAAVGFHANYPDVEFETYKSDYGLSVIYPNGKKIRKHFEDTEIAWEYFKSNAKKLLNIVD